MILGVVGNEEAKFDASSYIQAINIMNDLFSELKPDLVVSGACHLGGIDVWAVEHAKEWQIPTKEFAPKKQTWSGGYKERNLEIAKASDVVVCIVVQDYPENYQGMKFGYCYHCNTNQHVKSGGCWTVKEAIKMGKEGRIIVV